MLYLSGVCFKLHRWSVSATDTRSRDSLIPSTLPSEVSSCPVWYVQFTATYTKPLIHTMIVIIFSIKSKGDHVIQGSSCVYTASLKECRGLSLLHSTILHYLEET